MGVFRRQTKSLHDVCFVSTAFNSCFPDFSFVVILSKPLELQQRRLDLYNEDFIVLGKRTKRVSLAYRFSKDFSLFQENSRESNLRLFFYSLLFFSVSKFNPNIHQSFLL